MLEVGKTYELNSGQQFTCECSSIVKGERVYVINGLWYHEDGIVGCYEDHIDYSLHVRRCVDDTPTLWCDMTDAEKGALLLAKHEGEVIENTPNGGKNWYRGEPCWADGFAYRIKPEPKVETVTIGYSKRFGPEDMVDGASTHSITLTIRYGEVDPVAQVEKL